MDPSRTLPASDVQSADTMERRIAALEQAVARLAEENATLRGDSGATTSETPPRTAPAGTPEVSRRDLLGRAVRVTAAGAGLAVFGSALSQPREATATTDYVVLGGYPNDSGASPTYLTSSSAGQTLDVTNTGGGTGIRVSGAYIGIQAKDGTNPLVAEGGDYGDPTIVAFKRRFGRGEIIQARIDDAENPAAVVHATTPGTGPAFKGSSSLGRGAMLAGKKAQLRLVPSSAGSHPPSGAAGDLFVDSAKRVWFCKGSSMWVRLD